MERMVKKVYLRQPDICTTASSRIVRCCRADVRNIDVYTVPAVPDTKVSVRSSSPKEKYNTHYGQPRESRCFEHEREDGRRKIFRERLDFQIVMKALYTSHNKFKSESRIIRGSNAAA